MLNQVRGSDLVSVMKLPFARLERVATCNRWFRPGRASSSP